MSIGAALISHNENKYKEYIMNHKLNVEKAWQNIKNNPECIELIEKYMCVDSACDVIDDLVKNHDTSKFGKEEFDAYRKNFYPISPEEKESNKDAFDKAWEHHYTNN